MNLIYNQKELRRQTRISKNV